MAMQATHGMHSAGSFALLGDLLGWALPRFSVYVAVAVASAVVFLGWATFYTYVWPGKPAQPATPPAIEEQFRAPLPEQKPVTEAVVAGVQPADWEVLAKKLSAENARLSAELAQIEQEKARFEREREQLKAEVEMAKAYYVRNAMGHALNLSDPQISATKFMIEAELQLALKMLGAEIYDADSKRVGDVRAIVVNKDNTNSAIIRLNALGATPKNIAYPLGMIEWKWDQIGKKSAAPGHGILGIPIAQLQRLLAVPEGPMLGAR